MPSQVALSRVFRLALKILSSTFNYLHLFEHIFYKFWWFTEMIFMFLLCVFMLHFRGSFSQKNKSKKKTSGVIVICSGLENFFHILLKRDDWKLLN